MERAKRQFAGEDRPLFEAQRPIGAAREEVRYKRQVRAGEGVRRRDAELRTITGRRVQQIVGLVELCIGRQAGQLVTLGARPATLAS
jgi:hypothetical protein